MQLFSYLSDGQVRSARLIGLLGIDLTLAAQSYLENHEPPVTWPNRPLTALTDLASLGSEGIQLVKNATDWVIQSHHEADNSLQENQMIFEFGQATLLPPIPRPGKVICIAGNYPSEKQVVKPDYPTIFLKPSSGVVGDQSDILLPDIAQNVAYEVELAIVIGKRAHNITEAEARSVMAGFTVANDLGDRILEKRTSQWATGKLFDTFTPMGPIMVTSDEFINVGNLKLTTLVNGELMQSGNISQMFFNTYYLVSYLSTLTTLEPGDVILTGSPKLLGDRPNPDYQLKPGDIVQVEIEKLCLLTNTIKLESQVVK